VFGEFGLLELCRLTLFKFHIKVLKTKRKLNSPPPSWVIDPYNDILIFRISLDVINEVKTFLYQSFDIKDLSEDDVILNIKLIK
jgi:hypothetical protein